MAFGDRAGRIIGGILAPVTGGASLMAGAAWDSKRKADRMQGELSNAKPPSMELPKEVLSEYYGQAMDRAGAPAEQTNTYSAGPYASAAQSAGYVKGLDKSLGIKSPVDITKAQRTAAFGELDSSAYKQALADASRMQSQGQAGGALDLALKSKRGSDLSLGRAGIERQIQEARAQRQDAFDQSLRNAALGMGQNLTGQANEAARFAAQQDANNTAMRNAQNSMFVNTATRVGEGLEQNNMNRARTDYEVNQLFPFQVQQANQMAELARQDAKTGNLWNGFGTLIGGGIKVGTSVLGGGGAA